MGQNLGTIEASFYSDAIQGINIAAGASVFMGMQTKQLPLDAERNRLEANVIITPI